MTRSHGRCPKGERLRMGFPHGHRKTTTLVAGLRMTGMVAPMVLDGPINGDWFEAYVTKVLVPECGFRGHRAQHSDLIARSVPRIVRAGFRNDRAQFEVWSA